MAIEKSNKKLWIFFALKQHFKSHDNLNMTEYLSSLKCDRKSLSMNFWNVPNKVIQIAFTIKMVSICAFLVLLSRTVFHNQLQTTCSCGYYGDNVFYKYILYLVFMVTSELPSSVKSTFKYTIFNIMYTTQNRYWVQINQDEKNSWNIFDYCNELAVNKA